MKSIKGGLYLVVDPEPGIQEVRPRVEAALRGGVDVLQIWDHWHPGQNREEFVEILCIIARQVQVPVLVNESTHLLYTTSADGIHFDQRPSSPEKIRQKAGRPVLMGLTCGNDLERVQWAADQQFDYISFCAMFPSPSVDTCDIVSIETVQQARAYTDMPVFASGGVTPGNLGKLMKVGVNGVAVISGILKANDLEEAARKYKEAIMTKVKTNQ